MQAGKCPMVPLISASYCSRPLAVFYNLAPTRFVSWFLLGICWGSKAPFPVGKSFHLAELLGWAKDIAIFHGSTSHGEFISCSESSPGSAVLSSGLI